MVDDCLPIFKIKALKMAAIEGTIFFSNSVFVSVKVTFIITVLKVVYWGL